MLLNVRRFCISIFVLASFTVLAFGQTVTEPQSAQSAPTSGDVMRDRISKAKAFIAVRNYNAAIFELENIRKETGDAAVQGVASVLLMNSYLEQGDFKRAQDLLNFFYNAQKAKPEVAVSYAAVAGQIVKGARARADRYQALGLSVGDKALPLEAVNDLDKMRETLELVVTQAKEMGKTPARAADAMALHEEASVSRARLARDDYDSRRWKDEIADTRELMASSRSVVLSAVSGEPITEPKTEPAATAQPANGNSTAITMQPVSNDPSRAVREREAATPANKVSEDTVASNDRPTYIPLRTEPVREQPKPAEPKKDEPTMEEPRPVITVPSAAPSITAPGSGPAASSETPLQIGSLLAYATKQTPPVYPSAARSTRQTGVVKVEFTVDENGRVAQIQKTTGPVLLQNAAKDAIMKWEFRPFVRDGQPVKAIGFVNFNFNL